MGFGLAIRLASANKVHAPIMTSGIVVNPTKRPISLWAFALSSCLPRWSAAIIDQIITPVKITKNALAHSFNSSVVMPNAAAIFCAVAVCPHKPPKSVYGLYSAIKLIIPLRIISNISSSKPASIKIKPAIQRTERSRILSTPLLCTEIKL